MTRRIPEYLKLHTEERPEPPRTRREDFPSLEKLCHSFERATGWQLCWQPNEPPPRTLDALPDPSAIDESSVEELFVPGAPGSALAGSVPGELVLRNSSDRPTDPKSPVDQAKARELAEALNEILHHWHASRTALWRREAELAAGVPVSPRPDEEQHLAERLEAILKGGAEAVGCEAAALYLLDESTSELKLRAAWGLPTERFLDPPRPLRGAMADLEALVGHAVVLENTTLLPHWKAPEDFPCAVCVPVSSPSIPLGTLWVFSRTPRDFSEGETNLLEIVAGRLAADLDREVLVHEGTQGRQHQRNVQQAGVWQQERLPNIHPLLDDWQIAGWLSRAEVVGGDFYDWSVLPDANLAFAVASVGGRPMEAALGAATLHAAVKAHACYRHNPSEMLARCNETLWTTSVGDQFASAFYTMINPDTGEGSYSAAGTAAGLLIPEGKPARPLGATAHPLGTNPDEHHELQEFRVRRGETLVLLGEGVQHVLGLQGNRADRGKLREFTAALRKQAEGGGEAILDAARTWLLAQCPQQQQDWTILVAHRRRSR